jgi:hypothetical protein
METFGDSRGIDQVSFTNLAADVRIEATKKDLPALAFHDDLKTY